MALQSCGLEIREIQTDILPQRGWDLWPLSHAMQEDPQENLGQSLTEDCQLLSSGGNLYLAFV